MRKEIQKKIESCKALQGKTVMDVCLMPEFEKNLAAYWTAQRTDRETIRKSYDAMRSAGGAKGYKLPAHPIDRLMGLSAQELATEFMAIINRESKRPFSERQYITQLCNQAYNLTVAQFIVAEFPELKEMFFPKNDKN